MTALTDGVEASYAHGHEVWDHEGRVVGVRHHGQGSGESTVTYGLCGYDWDCSRSEECNKNGGEEENRKIGK